MAAPSPIGPRKRGPARSRANLVRADALRNYTRIVEDMGGNPRELLSRVGLQIDDAVSAAQFLPYRKMAELRHLTGLAVARPDFGLALAARQGAVSVLGPLEVATRNSPTLGDAMSYYMAHAVAFSSAVSITLEREPETGRPLFRFDVFVSPLPHSQQVSEHAMALLHHILIELTAGRVRARELWFAHGAVSPMPHYRSYFGTRVEMAMPYTALFLSEADLSAPLPNTATQLFSMADAFIDREFSSTQPLSAQVRSILSRYMAEGTVTMKAVAARLNMHPKTLERRLRDENNSFEAVRTDVRRGSAYRYITETSMPMGDIASMLGYAEPAVLTRVSHEWFGCSPRELRRRAAAGSGSSEKLASPDPPCAARTRVRRLERENARLKRQLSQMQADRGRLPDRRG
jgi:AraC-like DNA-binding protein